MYMIDCIWSFIYNNRTHKIVHRFGTHPSLLHVDLGDNLMCFGLGRPRFITVIRPIFPLYYLSINAPSLINYFCC
jgi:hypothetical protein